MYVDAFNLGFGRRDYRGRRHRVGVGRLHLVDVAYACPTHVGVKAQRAQGHQKSKRVPRLASIRQLKIDLRRVAWREAVHDVMEAGHERPVLRRLERLPGASNRSV